MMEYEKWHAIGMLEAGQSQNSIARHFAEISDVAQDIFDIYSPVHILSF